MKRILILEIEQKLLSLKVPFKSGDDSDIIISTDYINAISNAKIRYEASIMVNEDKNTVFMYENFLDSVSGNSLDTKESNSQPDLKKVKTTQYNSDIKAYEYILNLNDIPQAVKNVAKDNGWKFKTVEKIKKAIA